MATAGAHLVRTEKQAFAWSRALRAKYEGDGEKMKRNTQPSRETPVDMERRLWELLRF